jgi:FixJ family two-component response regulator
MSADATIYIVDDDIAMRDSLALLLGLKGFRTQIFASAENLLAAYSAGWFGCMLIDVRMPGMDGLQLHAELCRRDCVIPIVIMTAYGDVATARSVLKAGAEDFLEKPVDDSVLIDVLQTAIDAQTALRRTASRDKGIPQLTTREQQVSDMVGAGLQVKQIAEKLGISPRTVEVYKSRMSQKLRGRDGLPASSSDD